MASFRVRPGDLLQWLSLEPWIRFGFCSFEAAFL